MTNSEAIRKELEKYNSRCVALRSIPDVNCISHVSGDTIFTDTVGTVRALLAQTAPFDEKGWSLDHFYLSVGCICLRYTKDDSPYSVQFYCRDIEGAITWFGFDCRVVEEAKTEVLRFLVCNMGA